MRLEPLPIAVKSWRVAAIEASPASSRPMALEGQPAFSKADRADRDASPLFIAASCASPLSRRRPRTSCEADAFCAGHIRDLTGKGRPDRGEIVDSDDFRRGEVDVLARLLNEKCDLQRNRRQDKQNDDQELMANRKLSGHRLVSPRRLAPITRRHR